MEKIPTLFLRYFENHKVVGISEELTDPDLANALKYGIYTVKFDGSCCALKEGE